MHRVIFLPLTAPLAPADINWMRKQNARLYVAEVAAEHEALAATGWSVSPGQMGVGQFLVHKQNKCKLSSQDTLKFLCVLWVSSHHRVLLHYTEG